MTDCTILVSFSLLNLNLKRLVVGNKEDLIIQAAKKLIGQYGLKKTTVEDIARVAGIGKGTIYLYFNNKDEIFLACIKSFVDQMLTEITTAVNNEDSVKGKLTALILSRYRYQEDQFRLLNIASKTRQEIHIQVESMGLVNSKMRSISLEYSIQERKVIEGIISKGVELGELDVDDIEGVSLTLSATLHALDHPWLYGEQDLSVERKVALLVKLFIEGLAK